MPHIMAGTDGQSNEGVVVSCNPKSVVALIGPLSIDPILSFDDHYVIVTNVRYRPMESYQVQASTGSDFTIYTFGSLPEQITIDGIVAARKCAGAGGDGVRHGLSKLFNWWDSVKMTNRREPIEIVLASRRIKGYVFDSVYDVVDLSSYLFKFQISIIGMPEQKSPVSEDSGGGSSAEAESGIKTVPATATLKPKDAVSAQQAGMQSRTQGIYGARQTYGTIAESADRPAIAKPPGFVRS